MAKSKAPTNALRATGAAKAVGVSVGSLRTWLRAEKALAKLVERRDGMVLFPPAAMTELAKVRDRRFAKANPALRAAWAARKRKAAAAKKVRTRARELGTPPPAPEVPVKVKRGRQLRRAAGAAPAAAAVDLVNTIEKAVGELLSALREMLSRQAAEIERARRPLKLVLEPEE